MFAGLSAFPLTPMDERGIDEAAVVRLVARLAEAGVDQTACSEHSVLRWSQD